jgi:K+-transporting ATPase ATPase B chain
MALSIDGGLRRRLSLMSVVDTARGSRRIAREDRQDQAGGSPRNRGIFNPKMLRGALLPALRKLDPRQLMRNPVMFVVEVTAALVTVVFASDLLGLSKAAAGEVGRGTGFELQIAIWLWFTVYFATYAEALAEARGKAQAASLRKTRSETLAHRRCDDGTFEDVGSSLLRAGDVIVVREGETIAGDGDVIAGVAYVNEAVITGESAAVLKEPGTDIRSSVTGGTTITSDTLTICITANPGETFLDRMIALVEGAKRQRTPNEIALSILLSGLTIVFLLATATLRPFGLYSGAPLGIVVLVALLVCLIPTTIGGLLSAIGIAGMDRVARFNVLAMSGRAVEAAGDVDVLLLDKTGTITFGNRLASRIVALPGVAEREVLDAALLTSLEDETPEGRSVVELAKARLSDLDAAVSGSGVKAAPSKSAAAATPSVATLVPFSAESRTSGVILTDGTVVLKGAVDAIVAALDAEAPAELQTLADEISSLGATPLAIRRNGRPLGVIELKDTVKPGLKARFDELRRMGIRTIMVTGDNPLTAKTIAAEAGVDDYMAQAKPEDKIARIRAEQADGHLVAMTGDGTNDAPAVAQADVGLAMNSGTSACKEAANMVDLDSDPTKLIEVIAIGKQLLITRGAITTFSIANDVAKYFAILPAMFMVAYPELNSLNIMRLANPQSAILSAVIFNALVIIALVPLSLRGVAYRAAPAAELLRRNLLIYGVGGIFAPFIGIKLIDLLITAIHLA